MTWTIGQSIQDPWAIPSGATRESSLAMMEPKSASEELPALYRAVLDRVAQLEASSDRPLANRVRAEATHIYSRAWDERARRELLALLRRNAPTDEGLPANERSLRRRTTSAA
jgi:hypothetical protein